MEIRRLSGHGAVAEVTAASELFDELPDEGHTQHFLDEPGHVLLVAYDGAEPVGFVSGVEMTHPDKGTEMFLYELSVGEAHRRRGIGSALVRALGDLARAEGCYGMWVLTDADNRAALATYRATGAGEPESQVMFTWSFGEPSD